MSCEQYDWKAYALGEMTLAERREAEAHGAACAGCRNELAHVRLTVDTLSALREEEPSRRIAFVSDKVFEPRWWQMFLRPSFAAALVIAAAILMHGYLMRPAAGSADMQARIDRAVNQALERNLEVVDTMQRQMTQIYVANTGIVRQ